jgi:hypothetical protein
MNKLLEQLSVLLMGEEQIKLELRELQVQFIRNKKAILKQAKLCRKSHGLIGVYSPLLGKGMFLTTVDHIHSINDDALIVFKPYDPNGGSPERTAVPLKDISCICPFNQVYDEPQVSGDLSDMLVSKS